MSKTTNSVFSDKAGAFSFGQRFNTIQQSNPYAFKMTEEMKFTEDDIIRMNITLGITGDMFHSHGVFYTDFMQTQHEKKKKAGKQTSTDSDDTEDDPEDNEDHENEDRVDPTKELVNSMKPNYLKTAIQKDKHLKAYNADIDNFPGVRNIENFIIAAMTDEDDHGKLMTKGIIQIFNKDKTRVLNPWLQPRDIRRIEAMQKLLGSAVTKAELFQQCLTTLLGIGMEVGESNMIGPKRNVFEEDLAHAYYDVSNMVPSLDGIKRFLEFYYPEKPGESNGQTELISKDPQPRQASSLAV